MSDKGSSPSDEHLTSFREILNLAYDIGESISQEKLTKNSLFQPDKRKQSFHGSKQLPDPRKLFILWALWNDKSAAQTTATKVKLNKETAYRAFQAKQDIDKTHRKKIHLGLRYLILTLHDTIQTEEQLRDFIKDNKLDLNEQLVVDYLKGQHALSQFNENHSKLSLHKLIDTILAGSYATCSGIMKAASTVVVCLTLSIFPPAWVAIPLFAGFLFVLNLNLYGRVSKQQFTFIIAASVALLALGTFAVFAMPLVPWFYISIMTLIGFVASMQSFQNTRNQYRMSRKLSKSGGFLREFTHRPPREGENNEAQPMSGKERFFVLGICLPSAFLSSAAFTFIGYQALWFFVMSMPFLAGFAALPIAPILVFSFVAMMQLFSTVTAFRFCKNAFLWLSNQTMDDLKSMVSQKWSAYLKNWREHPVKTGLKTLLGLVLASLSILYTVVGAKVCSISFVNFSHLAATTVNKVVGILIGLSITIPNQIVYSYRANVLTFGLVTDVCHKIKKWFLSKIHPESKQPSGEALESLKIERMLQEAEAVHTAVDTTRSSANLILNALIGKAAQKVIPGDPLNSGVNMVTEAVYALISGVWGVWAGRSKEATQRDVIHLTEITNRT